MIAYLDMPSGISGDIFLSCLLDAGWTLHTLQESIERLLLPHDEWTIGVETVHRGAITAQLVHVNVVDVDQHRHLRDITSIIANAELAPSIKQRAVAVFQRLADAEATVHGIDVDSVHFHEVGALDAIIDIVGVCAGLEALEISHLYASAFPLGPGWSRSAHGQIPLPAPATLKLLANSAAPTVPAPGPGELVTPTGAALVCELATFEQPPMRLHTIGIGAGQKDFSWPNVARLWVAEPAAQPYQSEAALIQIDTNIDDMNPEFYPPVQHHLLEAGAKDVWLTSIQMKKGRPGTLLSVLAPAALEQELVSILLQETTTLGVRVGPVRRVIAARDLQEVATPYGLIRVKVKRVGGQPVDARPEFEDCATAAAKHGVPVQRIYDSALAAIHSKSKEVL